MRRLAVKSRKFVARIDLLRKTRQQKHRPPPPSPQLLLKEGREGREGGREKSSLHVDMNHFRVGPAAAAVAAVASNWPLEDERKKK
jgi:hypothetical protein